MVAAREDVGVGEALLRLRGYAFAHGEPIDQVAHRVIDCDLVLADDEDDDTDGPTGPRHGRDR